MSTYTSPVALADVQEYLKDSSTDAGLLAFFQSLLDASTEYVYTWLDRDFTPSATKTDTFMGNNTNEHRLHSAADHIVSWQYRDSQDVVTVPLTTEILLFESGIRAKLKTMIFGVGYEYQIVYVQPASITCPESIRHVILERAVIMYQDSNQGEGILGIEMNYARDQAYLERATYLDLSPEHKEILRMYKRYPV
jgi:hypothetical protein